MLDTPVSRYSRFVLLAGLLLAACDTAPPATPPSGELPCAGATADGAWEALSPPDLDARRLRLHGDYLFAVTGGIPFPHVTGPVPRIAGHDGLWRRDLRSGQPPGAPWDSLGLGIDSTLGVDGVLDVLADPADPDRMMAAADPLGFVGADNPSVLRTTDGGRTWEDVSDGDEFLVQPNFRVAMWRLYGEDDGEEPGTVHAIGSGFTFRTRDFGQSWERVADSDVTGAGPALLFPFSPTERHPTHPDVIWTGTFGVTFQIFLGGSADGGETWEFAYVCPPVCVDSSPTDFAFDAADERVVYLGTTGGLALLKSEDFGRTWRNTNTLGIGNYEALLGHPSEPGRLWGGVDRVVWPRFRMVETEDGGETWSEIEVPEAVVPEGARVRDFLWEAAEEAILVGTSRGVYRYRPGRTTGLECE